MSSELRALACQIFCLSRVNRLQFYRGSAKPCVLEPVCFQQLRTIALHPVLSASDSLRWLTALERGIMCRLPMPAQPEVINSSNPSQSSQPERAEDVRLMHLASKHMHHQILTSPHACLWAPETFRLRSDPGCAASSLKHANSACAAWTFFCPVWHIYWKFISRYDYFIWDVWWGK